MESDGQLLWKPRASHESHLANFSKITGGGGGGGGHDGDCFQELGAQLPSGCGGPGKPVQLGRVGGAVNWCDEAGVV